MTARVDSPRHGDEVCEVGAAEAPTVGVEEEFTLLDPATGGVVADAEEIIRDCHDPDAVGAESMRFMVETRTPVCHDLRDVREALRVSRNRVAEVAQRHRTVVVATGVAPFGMPDPPPITNEPRYVELNRRFPAAMSTAGTCGCHVHVGVPTRQIGVEVLLRMRPWLPVLVALTANSPIWQGRDAGWASQRTVLTSRWATAVPAPPVSSIEEYDALLDAAVGSGHALDDRSVYFLARLSPRYPTVEIRIADVSLTADETVGYVGLVRALVATVLDQARRDRRDPVVGQAFLAQACRSAARTGLDGDLTDPRTGREVPAWDLVDRLVALVRPSLRAHGDEAVVLQALERIRRSGGGAQRQRRLFGAAASPSAFVASLAATTTADLAG